MILPLILALAQIQQNNGPASWYISPQAGAATVVEPDPKCGEYQHVQHTYGHCANTCGPDPTYACTTNCLWVGPSVSCVDDPHEITERDWQGLMKRVEKLEKLEMLRPNAKIHFDGNPGPAQHIELPTPTIENWETPTTTFALKDLWRYPLLDTGGKR